nr:CvpA family protein [Enterococcus innesii]
MIGLFVLVLLLAAFYGGARRGTSLQLVSVLGYLIFFLCSCELPRNCEKIELYVPYMSVTADSKLKYYDMELALDLDKAYYAAIAFVMVLFAGWLITKLLVIFADSLRYKRLRFLGGYDWAVAGVLNVILMYINLYMFFMILSMIPFATIQNLFETSGTANFIVDRSPILSDYFYRLWITDVIG